MSGSNVQYDEEFKRTLVDLYNNGRTQVSLCKEYGVSSSALARWIKRYSTVKIEVLKKAYTSRGCPKGLMFHSDRGTQYTSYAFKKFWMNAMLYNHFQKRDIHMITPAVKASSGILKKKRPTAAFIIHMMNFTSQFLNI